MLVRLTKRARVNRALAFRARIVLACIDASDTTVAHRLRTTKTTVAKWRRQLVQRRLEGWYDEPRVGASRTMLDEQVEAPIVKTLETTPAGETHWSTRSRAKAAGISHTMVGRIWRTSIPQLRAAILAYVDAHNTRGAPFSWVKTADEILDRMRRFGLRVQQVHGQ